MGLTRIMLYMLYSTWNPGAGKRYCRNRHIDLELQLADAPLGSSRLSQQKWLLLPAGEPVQTGSEPGLPDSAPGQLPQQEPGREPGPAPQHPVLAPQPGNGPLRVHSSAPPG